ncbi:MAG TPA: hypothetical protein VFU04_03070, partial [Solirubrobacterales bacterium]|nr:hypothetical protein [Solirubrobacterales bacterium]
MRAVRRPMSIRFTALAAMLAGTVVGLTLLLGDAPFWTFFAASLGVLPILFAYLVSQDRGYEGGLADLIAPLPRSTSSDSLGEIASEDPYVSVMTLHGSLASVAHPERTPNSLYVVLNPDERERLRINTLHRLGL